MTEESADDSKRQVYPGAKWASRLGELVEPEVLGRPHHNQQAPSREIQCDSLFLKVLVLEVETPCRS